MLRPPDTDLLVDLCRDVALDAHGFLYLPDDAPTVVQRYDDASTEFRYANSVSRARLRRTLASRAANDETIVERLRTGAFYWNPFETVQGPDVHALLLDLLADRLVLTPAAIDSAFDVAPADVAVLTTELVRLEFLRSITVGELDVYEGGSRLAAETTRPVTVARTLRAWSSDGIIDRDDLVDRLDVTAPDDVIAALERDDYVVDIDDAYLVRAAIPDLATAIADEIEADVREALQPTGVLPTIDFDARIEHEIAHRRAVLQHLGPGDAGTLLSEIRRRLLESKDVKSVTDPDVVVDCSQFEAYLRSRPTPCDADHGLGDVAPESPGLASEMDAPTLDSPVREYVESTLEDQRPRSEPRRRQF
jgi:hypothetical protein